YSVGKKLRLSDAGYTMLNATHSIYSVLNKATDEIQQTTSATQGTINIGVLASIEDHVFENFAIKYYEANPNVIISLHMLTRKEIWERLENNRIDLAVMYLPDESIKNWKPYQSKKIIQDELLFISGDEKLAKKKRIKFKDTTLNPWVTYPENYYLDQVVKESYKNQLADLPTAVARFTTPQQIYRFVAATNTNTALPNSFMVANPATDKLHTLSFEPAIKFDLNFVFRKDKDQIPRIKNFLDEFDAYLRTEDYISRLQKINQK
ncbi:LysR family transcriptional regulator, partial [Lactiplantibacillus plantarum]